MKKFFIGGALLLFILGSCNSHAGHNHDHEAEGHDHEAEAPHGHDEHEHGNEPAGHSDEISLPAAKAKAAGVVAETVNPAPFRQVIPVSGQILAAQGDDATVVATASGVVSFARKLTEGMQVGKVNRPGLSDRRTPAGRRPCPESRNRLSCGQGRV